MLNIFKDWKNRENCIFALRPIKYNLFTQVYLIMGKKKYNFFFQSEKGIFQQKGSFLIMKKKILQPLKSGQIPK